MQSSKVLWPFDGRLCYNVNQMHDRRFARDPSNCTNSATYELAEPEFEPKP